MLMYLQVFVLDGSHLTVFGEDQSAVNGNRYITYLLLGYVCVSVQLQSPFSHGHEVKEKWV